MDIGLILFAVGAGCIWHGLQVIWVAPLPSQFDKDKVPLEKGSPLAFQRFWLDQYAWIGIVLAVLGLGLLLWGLVQ